MWPELGHRLAGFSGRYSGSHRVPCHVAGVFRGSYLDTAGVVLCVIMMSISALFYVILGQYLVSMLLRLVPISGYDIGLEAVKFLVLPVIVGVVGGIGASTRLCTARFSWKEINKDYVRTAHGQGFV